MKVKNFDLEKWKEPVDTEFPDELWEFKKKVLDYSNGIHDYRTISYENGQHFIRYLIQNNEPFKKKVTVYQEGEKLLEKEFTDKEEADGFLLSMIKKYSIKSML